MSWRAVVDLGSLSTNLLLTDGVERVRRSVDTFMGGATLSAAGEVVPAPISERSLALVASTLDEYRSLATERGAEVAVVATSAARRATNRDQFRALVEDKLDVEPIIIDGVEEARLGFLGASRGPLFSLEPETSLVTIDLGGGSTEFGLGTASGWEQGWSLPMGGSLLSRAYLPSDPPRPEELSAALSVVELHIDDLHREMPAFSAALATGQAQVLGLGAVVTVAAVEVGLLETDPLNGEGDGPLHGFELTREAVEDVFRTIATESRSDRAHNPGLPASRVDDSVGACAVLVEVMRQLGLDSIVVSQRGLADGIAVLGAGDELAEKWWPRGR